MRLLDDPTRGKATQMGRSQRGGWLQSIFPQHCVLNCRDAHEQNYHSCRIYTEPGFELKNHSQQIKVEFLCFISFSCYCGVISRKRTGRRLAHLVECEPHVKRLTHSPLLYAIPCLTPISCLSSTDKKGKKAQKIIFETTEM